jgi:hypothetical protein
MKRKLLLSICLLAVISAVGSGCGPTLDENALATQIAATVYAERTAQAQAFTPTFTPTPTPNPTDTPTATPTHTPTNTPSSTPTSTLTPTPTSTKTPTPIPPTPTPADTPTPRPTPTPRLCPPNPALVQIENDLDVELTITLKGPEEVIMVLPANTQQNYCMVPGEYSYTATDPKYGTDTGTTAWAYTPGDCHCWEWYAGIRIAPPLGGGCRCSTDPAQYMPPRLVGQPVSSPAEPPTTAETSSGVTAPGPEPTVILLESGSSVDQLGSREVIDVDINPQNPREVYALVKGDGIYKSSNGGDGPWVRMNVDGSAITTFVIDPHNPARFYAPTWNGVLKSNDGGNSWQVNTSGLSTANRPVDALAVHPGNPNILYAGIGSTFVISEDGGESWTDFLYGNGLQAGERLYQIVVDPFNHDVIYVGGAAGSMYKSVNGGRDFTQLPPNMGEGTFSLVAHPTQRDVYLAGINSYDAGILKTENGADFRSVSKGLIFGGADSAYCAIAYAPSNPDIVYAGSGYGDDRVAKGIFKSTDGGESWTGINNGLRVNPQTGFPHYVKSIAVHPTNSNMVFAATGSGLYKSADGGASWSLR